MLFLLLYTAYLILSKAQTKKIYPAVICCIVPSIIMQLGSCSAWGGGAEAGGTVKDFHM